jgi:hypothetical protein
MLIPQIVFSSEDLLKMRFASRCNCSGVEGIEVLVWSTGEFRIERPGVAIPEIIRKISHRNCKCSSILFSVEQALKKCLQAAVHYHSNSIPKSYDYIFRAKDSQEEPIWKAIAVHYQEFSRSFEEVSASEQEELVSSVDLTTLSALLRFVEGWDRELLNVALRRLFRSVGEILSDVLEYQLRGIRNESELFDDIRFVAEHGVGKEADEAYKALHRLVENCELTYDQLEGVLRMKGGAASRLLSGRFAVAKKLMGHYQSLKSLQRSTVCMLSDALLAAPSSAEGLEYQHRLLCETNSTVERSYLRENIIRMRT